MPVAVLDDSDERFQLGDSSEGAMGHEGLAVSGKVPRPL